MEEKAKREAKTQTQYIEDLIEKDIGEEKKQKRLEALDRLVGCVPAGSLVDVDVRQMRIERAISRAK